MSRQTALHVRLNALQFLGDRDFDVLAKLLRHVERAGAGELVVVENQELNRTRVLLSGWACRYKSFADGRRQILNLLLPGDVIGFYAIMLNRSDYGVETITPVDMAVFPAVDLVESLAGAPHLTLGLSWVAGQSERLLDEQITRIGRRNASERMAHLFVELFLRLRRSGFDHDAACCLPLTQSVLADALGMSHVHANRSFRALARERAVSIRDGKILLDDIARLARRARFDARYLEQSAVPERTKRAVKKQTML